MPKTFEVRDIQRSVLRSKILSNLDRINSIICFKGLKNSRVKNEKRESLGMCLKENYSYSPSNEYSRHYSASPGSIFRNGSTKNDRARSK